MGVLQSGESVLNSDCRITLVYCVPATEEKIQRHTEVTITYYYVWFGAVDVGRQAVPTALDETAGRAHGAGLHAQPGDQMLFMEKSGATLCSVLKS